MPSFGACGRTRTGDLLITSELLYQLSHTSISFTDAGYYTICFTCRQLSFFRAARNTVCILSRVFLHIFPQAPGRAPVSPLHSSKSPGRKPPFPAIFRFRVCVLPSPTDQHNIFCFLILQTVIHIIHRVFHTLLAFVFNTFRSYPLFSSSHILTL